MKKIRKVKLKLNKTNIASLSNDEQFLLKGGYDGGGGAGTSRNCISDDCATQYCLSIDCRTQASCNVYIVCEYN